MPRWLLPLALDCPPLQSLSPLALLTRFSRFPCLALPTSSPLLPLAASPPLLPPPPPNTLLYPSAAMADMCSPDPTGNNVGVAFGLVTASGLATSLGAAAAFWMPLPKPGATSNPWLAASLGAAAGVMVYVSFVEIFVAKSVVAFEKCIDRSEVAYLYATLCFFGGVLLTVAFDKALHLFEHWAQRRLHAKRAAAAAVEGDAEEVPAPEAAAESIVVAADAGEAEAVDVAPALGGVVVAAPFIHRHLPLSGVDSVEVDAEAAQSGVAQGSHPSDSSNWTDEGEGARSSPAGEGAGASSAGVVLGLADDDKARQEAMQPIADSNGHGSLLQPSFLESAKAKKDLIRMGMFAGIALAAHNFPEGLATFIAALQDPGVGVSVAVAIGIHKYAGWAEQGLFGQLGRKGLRGWGSGVCAAGPPPGRLLSAAVSCWRSRVQKSGPGRQGVALRVFLGCVVPKLEVLLTYTVAGADSTGLSCRMPDSIAFFFSSCSVMLPFPCPPSPSPLVLSLACSTASPRALPLPCLSTMRRDPKPRPSSGPPCRA